MLSIPLALPSTPTNPKTMSANAQMTAHQSSLIFIQSSLMSDVLFHLTIDAPTTAWLSADRLPSLGIVVIASSRPSVGCRFIPSRRENSENKPPPTRPRVQGDRNKYSAFTCYNYTRLGMADNTADNLFRVGCLPYFAKEEGTLGGMKDEPFDFAQGFIPHPSAFQKGRGINLRLGQIASRIARADG